MSNNHSNSKEFYIDREPWSLEKGVHDFYIQIAHSDLKAFQHPRLFIRKGNNTGVLRLNFCTYFTVRIPEKFRADLQNCRFLEIILSTQDNSEHTSQFAAVSHVLKFPEIYEFMLNSQKQKAAGMEVENSGSDPASEYPPEDNDEEKNEEENEDFEHLDCLQSIAQWLAAHNSFSMKIKKYGDHNFCLITDNLSKLFLVCCFERSGEWLADEEPFAGNIPLYFSETSHIVSPVFSIKAVTDHWYCRTGLKIPGVVLFNDALHIINTAEISLEWTNEPVLICSGNRKYPADVIKNFDSALNDLLESGSLNFTAEQISALTGEFENMDNCSMNEVFQKSIRSHLLKQILPGEYTPADILRVWLSGNFGKSIMLARYLDEQSGEFFALVYNFSNIALVWEHTGNGVNPFIRVQEIREKLLESKISSALTPCVLAENISPEYGDDRIKCYDRDAFFYLEDTLFAREMQFDRYPEMSCEDVHNLVNFANKTFSRDAAAVAEEYAPEHYDRILDTLFTLENRDEKKIFVQYETNLFERSLWTVVLQQNDSKLIIAIRSFNGRSITKQKNKDVQEHRENSRRIPAATLKTIFIVPEKISKIPEDKCTNEMGVFYVRIEDFTELICSILNN